MTREQLLAAMHVEDMGYPETNLTTYQVDALLGLAGEHGPIQFGSADVRFAPNEVGEICAATPHGRIMYVIAIDGAITESEL